MSQKSYDGKPIIYLVPTPIGNIEDITIRALNILKEADIIFAEDTRVTNQLLSHYDIKKKLISSHLYNEQNNISKLNDFIKEGKNVAVVSDRGTPVISDPGIVIVNEAIKQGYNVVCLPGPTAFVPAIIMSGLLNGPFTFYGFLNSKESKRKKELEDLREEKHTLIFYEAPHRITKTLENIKEVMGNRNIAIAREISKKYEEILRGTVEEILPQTEDIKGEMVLIVDGNHEEKDYSELSIEDHINIYIKEGKTSNEAIKLVAKDRGLKKGDVYNEYHRRAK